MNDIEFKEWVSKVEVLTAPQIDILLAQISEELDYSATELHDIAAANAGRLVSEAAAAYSNRGGN